MIKLVKSCEEIETEINRRCDEVVQLLESYWVKKTIVIELSLIKRYCLARQNKENEFRRSTFKKTKSYEKTLNISN